jgi:tetratricopeptide (TPR) repeat protein
LQFVDLGEYYEYSKLGFEQALADHDSLFVSSFFVDIGYYFKYIGDFQKSLIELNRAEKIALKNNYREILVYTYTALGTVYLDVSFYERALEYHSKSLEIKEEIGESPLSISISYNNIGLVYYKIGDTDKAEEYYNDAINLKLQEGDTSSCISTYINLGLAFSEQNNIDKYDKAIDYFQKAIVLAKKHNVFYRIGFSYNGLAKGVCGSAAI